MKKLLLSLVTLAGAFAAQATDTVLWEGTKTIDYSQCCVVSASKCANMQADQQIIVEYTQIPGKDYYALGLIKGNWGNWPAGTWETGGIDTPTSTTFDIYEACLPILKSEGFFLMGNGLEVHRIIWRDEPRDKSILLDEPRTITTDSEGLTFTYNKLVAAGAEEGGGVLVEYTFDEGGYINYLHQGDSENEYTWVDFSNMQVSEADGKSILILNKETLDEINSYGKTLVVQGGYCTINKVKVIKPIEIPGTAIVLDMNEAEVGAGKTLQLTATTNPAGQKVTWTSSDEAIATVDYNGLVTGVAAGNVTITAAAGTGSATCAVTVTENSIAAFLENGKAVESLELWMGDMHSPRLLFHTTPADARVTIKLENEEPAGCVQLYDYKPNTYYDWYNATVSANKPGTATVVAYFTANPEVKVEIPVVVKDYDNPTLKIEPWGETIDTEAVSPGQEPYEIYAGIKLPGGDIDWDVLMDESYTYVYTSSDPEVATVEAGGDYPSLASVVFTGTPGDVTISVVMTPPAGSTYPSMEASQDFTVLDYGKVKYTFDYYYGDWKANYGFPDAETITDFTAVGKKVDMFFSNVKFNNEPMPLEGSTFEFKVTDPNVRILSIGGSPNPSTPARVTFADKVTVDKGSVDGSSWKPDAADEAVGVESVRFTCTADVTSICFWYVTLMYYAPAEVTVDRAEASVKEGETLQLTATVSGEHILPGAATIWSSSDESVATVDADGLVTAVAEGEAVITAEYSGSKAECTVTVEKKSGILDIEADNAEPVEFYNINGMRVDGGNLAPGIYIRRQGTNATKVLVK